MEIEDGTAIGAKHYQLTGAQPIEIMQNVMTAEEFVGFYFVKGGIYNDQHSESRKER